MLRKRTRVLLRADVTEEDVADACMGLEWELVGSFAPSDEQPFERLYLDDAHENTISFIKDHLVGLNYLVFRVAVPDADVADDADRMRERLPHIPPSELVACLMRPLTPDAVYAAAIGGIEERGELVQGLRAAAADNDSQVRQAFVLAVGYLNWPEFEQTLIDLKFNDRDAEVRISAERRLEAMRLPEVEEF